MVHGGAEINIKSGMAEYNGFNNNHPSYLCII